MRTLRASAGLVLALIGFVLAGPASAGTRAKKDAHAEPAHVAAAAPAQPKKPDCPRANYPGDPVCAWEDDQALPTPSARAVRREIPDDVVINDKVSVGSADPVAMARPPVQSANPYPVRKKEPVGGGAAVNYRF